MSRLRWILGLQGVQLLFVAALLAIGVGTLVVVHRQTGATASSASVASIGSDTPAVLVSTAGARRPAPAVSVKWYNEIPLWSGALDPVPVAGVCGADGYVTSPDADINGGSEPATPDGRLAFYSHAEPSLAVNPVAARAQWAAYAQVGRWSNDGAMALGMGTGTIGASTLARSTQRLMPVTRCGGALPSGTTPASYPAWYRGSDPVVEYSADGATLYALSFVFHTYGATMPINIDANTTVGQAMLLHRSTDNGVTWEGPFVVLDVNWLYNHGLFDKPWMRAHPSDARKLYIVYVSYDLMSGFFQSYLQRSSDGGVTWSPPDAMVRGPGPFDLSDLTSATARYAEAQFNDLLFSRRTRGALLNAFSYTGQANEASPKPALVVSTNDGASWTRTARTYATQHNPYLAANAPDYDYYSAYNSIFHLYGQDPDLGAQTLGLEPGGATPETAHLYTPVNRTAKTRGAGAYTFFAMDTAAASPAYGDLYLATSDTRFSTRRVTVSARTCRSATVPGGVPGGCTSTVDADTCTADPSASASACVRVRAPLGQVVLVRSRDDGITFGAPVSVHGGGLSDAQSEPAGIAVAADGSGIVAVLYRSATATQTAGPAFYTATKVAFFRPAPSGSGVVFAGEHTIVAQEDIAKQANAGRGHMMGDYEAIRAHGRHFVVAYTRMIAASSTPDALGDKPKPQVVDTYRRSMTYVGYLVLAS